MALNWTMLNATTRSPVPLPNETITTTINNVEMKILVPEPQPRTLEAIGNVYFTDQRVGFCSSISGMVTQSIQLVFTSHKPADGSSTSFDSLSVPLLSILSTKFEQPSVLPSLYETVTTFTAPKLGNYVIFEIRPSAEGGLVKGTMAEVRPKDGGLVFGFYGTLQKAREAAIFRKRQEAENEQGLPVYTSPTEGSSTSSAGVSTVPVDSPPGYEA
ncbi:hypothetical protein FB45DRAFT_786673 [Roridomyces roridus]|uniref:Uncharacterized protein n=1 Tax=Roridomyces roridus TaxID=1738132 RepID=A0AAD7C5Q3_9AGAR|nr:hypothetical protein FB45DRAFT_786673 [Roridomyces roridus]